MKIFDCFTFYNELDLLDIRLAETADVVDWFVIVESDRTFQNNPKPRYLQDNWDRYKKYHKKIFYVEHTSPASPNPWTNEHAQRNAILAGLSFAKPNDLIIIGDADELLRRETILTLIHSNHETYGFRMPLFNFKFNYMLTQPHCNQVWSAATKRSLLGNPEDFRHRCITSQSGMEAIDHAGWHFTYLGNDEFAKTKLQSFAHSESNIPSITDCIDIEQSIKTGAGVVLADQNYRFSPVAMDKYFPDHLRNYPQWTLPGDFPSVRHYLP